MVEVLTGDQTHRFWLKLGSRLNSPLASPRRVLPPGLGEAVQPVEMDLEMIRGLLGEQASLIGGDAEQSRLAEGAVDEFV